MLKKLSFLLLIAFLSIITTIYLHKNKHKKPATLNLVSLHKIKTLDPILCIDTHSFIHINSVYETLFKYDPFQKNEIKPCLSKNLPIKENNSYVIKLKKGVKFQNDECFSEGKGRELKSHDIKFSILRNADPNLNGKHFWLLDGKIKGLNRWRKNQRKKNQTDYNEEVEGLKIIDDYTIKISFEGDNRQFYQIFASPFSVIIPKEAQDYYKKDFGNSPVGTGPYEIKKFDPQSNKIVYSKNSNYRDERFPTEIPENLKLKFKNSLGKTLPLVDNIIVHIVTETSTRLLKFKNREVDAINITNDNINFSLIKDGKLISDLEKKGIYLYNKNEVNTSYIGFNFNNKIFNNIKLRRAISLAFDRKKYNKLFYNDNSTTAQSMIPPSIEGYEKKYINPYCAYDVERAKQLLEEAGYPQGKGLPKITLDIRSGTIYRQKAIFFKECMREIGIEIKIRTNPFSELLNRIFKGNFMLFDLNWQLDFPDAENILQLFYSKHITPNGFNFTRFKNEKFDELYEKINLISDQERRIILYEEMNRILGDLVPAIFLNHKNHLVLCQPWISYIWTPFNFDLIQYIDIDDTIKQKFQISK
ncbi:MAG: hypothetical protein GY830_11115 [Bacteroidetes bacterium]|nr:hypothetical protein [Bacteroidota bacterium]